MNMRSNPKLNVKAADVGGVSTTVQMKSKPDTVVYATVKRSIDLVGACVGLTVFFPVMLIIAVALKIQDFRSPVLFKQQRVGKRGYTFTIYKFRSMVRNAEEMLVLNPFLHKKYIQNNYKLEPHEDPRITKLGRFLRATSLDELPQFMNVFKGDMSLVGPRPVVEKELQEYGHQVHVMLSVKPGLTGYWQVCGRSNVGYPERVDLDLYYIRHQSIRFDITILWKTVGVVLRRKGAH